MTKKITCQKNRELKAKPVRVRVIQSTETGRAELRNILLSRAKALVV